ncbi:E3 ubiquitin-protein ligase RLIM [Prunus yedoensis var. nudiflora]|uniref:RING-type E3 ubiquitin transferase n=1 Tax=Prunus yedoensis var. nudiflora TaxID=2094558 RepID=A0A314ZMD0_PRUYE|nr:E3 ubiquitin-protein ligase RLIM [Prunus yedoensis var. nudiflora]
MGDHQTFWCHECDMSVSLVPCSAQETLLCPHCFSDLLELMDSSSASSSSSFSDHQHNSQDNFLLNSPFLHRLIHHLSTHPINHDDRLPSPTAAVPPSSLPASKASVDAIPTLKITSSMLDLDPLLLCAVCKDPFLHSVDAKQLPCNHLYHPHCILPWLSSHSSCPLCRFQLPTDTHQPHLRHQNQNTPCPSTTTTISTIGSWNMDPMGAVSASATLLPVEGKWPTQEKWLPLPPPMSMPMPMPTHLSTEICS